MTQSITIWSPNSASDLIAMINKHKAINSQMATLTKYDMSNM